MRLSDFDYELPEELIAQYPLEKRDHSKLMVVHRKDGKIEHKRFYNIIEYLRPGDLIVINETKVFPARLFAVKDRTDAKVEVFLLRELENNLWEVLVKPARKVRIGNKLTIAEGVQCDVIDNTVSGGRVVRFVNISREELYKLIDEVGQSPLPPYIKRDPTPEDKKRYQTVYAKKRGAVAAPTAGLHFTEELLEKIKQKGVKVASIVLHIGLGTFRPVTVEDLSRHRMDSEYFEVSPETALAINEAKEKGRRIIAVGTSVVRCLETVSVSGFQISPKRGWTDKFIYPPYQFKIIDAIITNFHQPKSTLLMMVSAFAGHELIMKAYQEAIREKYRFYKEYLMFLDRWCHLFEEKKANSITIVPSLLIDEIFSCLILTDEIFSLLNWKYKGRLKNAFLERMDKIEALILERINILFEGVKEAIKKEIGHIIDGYLKEKKDKIKHHFFELKEVDFSLRHSKILD